MISLILNDGTEYTELNKIGTSGAAYSIPREDFNLERNFYAKSNNDGSEEIGQRRIESTSLSIRGDWCAETDDEFREKINSLIQAFNKASFIKEELRVLKVIPRSYDISYDRGCFRRNGTYSLSFERIDPTWQNIAETTRDIFVVPNVLTYDIFEIGNAFIRSVIEFRPSSPGELGTVEIVSRVPGTAGVPDIILGTIVLEGITLDSGWYLVIDNIKGECYRTNDTEIVDIRELIVSGTSFFPHGAGRNGITFYCENKEGIFTMRWKNRFFV